MQSNDQRPADFATALQSANRSKPVVLSDRSSFGGIAPSAHRSWTGHETMPPACSKRLPKFRFWRGWVLISRCCLTFLVFNGCSRAHYRRNADNAAAEIITEDNRDPRWQIRDPTRYADPRSRFYEPSNPA